MSQRERSAADCTISVVVPVFNEAGLLNELRDRITENLQQPNRDLEGILVDEESTDGTSELAQTIHGEDARFSCAHPSLNFHHLAAVTPGSAAERPVTVRVPR